MTAWDERETVEFRFNVDSPEGAWGWQASFLEWLHTNRRCIVLKARQLGVTWIAGAYAAWLLLYRPGSLVLVYRQKQEEAEEVVQRIWTLMQSLPKLLWNGARVRKPARNSSPSNEIELAFESGHVSRLIGMTSTGGAGHGKTAALTIMDEHARIDRAGEIMKAVSAVAGQTGKVVIVSTANGRHNPETGEGNDFHRLWENSHEEEGLSGTGFVRCFLSWRLHPGRDDVWYANSSETRTLKESERREQYPDNPMDAFSFSQATFFDKEALLYYADGATRKPEYRFTFVESGTGKAKVVRKTDGIVSVFLEPESGHSYSIAADVATGRGLDSSAAYVIDMTSMELVAEVHGKPDADEYALQLHFLGRWYLDAQVAVEDAGGWGEPVVIFLRDGRRGRPPYPRQYQHRQFSRADVPEHKPFGFPMNTKTRPLVLEGLELVLRERTLPFVTPGLLEELGNFVHRETNPSPRAADGCHDDRVMAAAVAVELFRQRLKPTRRRDPDDRPVKRTRYPWQASKQRRTP